MLILPHFACWVYNRRHPESWLFRTSRAREALLENTLPRKRPSERIQQQPLLFMGELSTGSAEEPESCVTVESRKAWKDAWLIYAPERTGKHQTVREASLVLARNHGMRVECALP